MISFQEDDYTRDLIDGHARWVVTLNNGMTVYYDDYRPNLEEASSWLRLKKYCDDNNLYITKLYIHFRSNYKSFPENKDGYYFSKSARGYINNNETVCFYNIGWIEGDIVHCEKIRVPELILETVEDRTFEDCKIGLIRKKESGTSIR